MASAEGLVVPAGRELAPSKDRGQEAAGVRAGNSGDTNVIPGKLLIWLRCVPTGGCTHAWDSSNTAQS